MLQFTDSLRDNNIKREKNDRGKFSLMQMQMFMVDTHDEGGKFND